MPYTDRIPIDDLLDDSTDDLHFDPPFLMEDEDEIYPVMLASDEEEEPDIETKFVEAISQIDTQPLIRPHKRFPVRWSVALLMMLFLVGGLSITVWHTLFPPLVTVTVVPVTHSQTVVTTLAVPMRSLAPVTLSMTQEQNTTGTGHQDATSAHGKLTFYNGSLVSQHIAAGTILTGHDGIQVRTDTTVWIPAATPPLFGQASVEAHAVLIGSSGNIRAGDMQQTCCADGVVVNNLTSFIGGRDARTYRAVASQDVDSLTHALHETLMRQIQQVFVVSLDEDIFLTQIQTNTHASHQVGDEATTVSVTMSVTAQAVAYAKQALQDAATRALARHTNPGAGYSLLLPSVHAHLTQVTPVQAVCTGTWVATFNQAQLQRLAQEIAGKTPQQAAQVLLASGKIAHVQVSTTLPQDPNAIHFLVILPEQEVD
ncbi:MAG TPA: hypothetical protein VFA41_04870 [Ktedonobacteraceae bacterium]|jgi:hypothetical protein|nr:hypothetical protein [Ktedonobacteraceae bacterium]